MPLCITHHEKAMLVHELHRTPPNNSGIVLWIYYVE